MPNTQIGAESARCKSNVVRLPSAAKREVRQSPKAARAAREHQPWRGEYIPPHVREAKKIGFQRSPEMLLILAMIKVLSPAQRTEMKHIIFRASFIAGDDHSHAAYDIIKEMCGDEGSP